VDRSIHFYLLSKMLVPCCSRFFSSDNCGGDLSRKFSETIPFIDGKFRLRRVTPEKRVPDPSILEIINTIRVYAPRPLSLHVSSRLEKKGKDEKILFHRQSVASRPLAIIRDAAAHFSDQLPASLDVSSSFYLLAGSFRREKDATRSKGPNAAPTSLKDSTRQCEISKGALRYRPSLTRAIP